MNTIARRERRQDRLIQERVHDPYKTKRKLPEPTVCPTCGAVYSEGRWQWAKSYPWGANEVVCQACHRIADRYPAGIVTASGDFVREHREEILNMIRHQEALEKEEHPLHCIMSVEQQPDAVIINTTDIHLPRRIGEALRRAHKGELSMRCEEGAYFIRVQWRRE